MMKGNVRSLILIIFLFFYKDGFSQLSHVNNRDSINQIFNAGLHYLGCYFDDLNIEPVKSCKRNNCKSIIYRTFDSSRVLFEGFVNSHSFKKLLTTSLNDNASISLCILKKRKFKKVQNIRNFKKASCYFDFFPLVRQSNHIYMKIMCRSMIVELEEYIGNIYLIFDEKMQLVFSDNEQIIIDK